MYLSNEPISEPPISYVPFNFISSQAASELNGDTRQLIRTAKIKFKVNDIPQATSIIEDITLKNKGFIARSNISKENSNTQTINISPDSAVLIHYYKLAADLTLKVPASKLDTLLKEIAPLAKEIEYRVIETQDISAELLEEKLNEERLLKKQSMLTDAIEKEGRKQEDIITAVEAFDNALGKKNKAMIAAHNLNDQIEFSTLNIYLYQNEISYNEKVLREKSMEDYELAFSSKVIEALANGWAYIGEFFILLLNIWPLLLVTGGVILFIIKYKKKKVK